MKIIEDFTGLYPLSKTLRFKLIPIGKTLEHIEEGHLLDEDRHRADSYTAVKKLIDEYHKEFIEKSLADFRLKEESQGKKDSLEEYFTYYQIPKKEESQAKAFTTIQENLRKQITERLTSEDAYKRIFKKELIQEDLVSFVTASPQWRGCLDLVNEFKEFTTYFTGFHENRKNMYSAEEKSTAIAYRLIHENLPKFVDNMRAFEMLSGTEIADILPELYNNFKGYLKVSNIEDIFRLNYYSVVITQKQIEIYNAIIGGKSEEGDIKIKGLNEYINLYNQRHKTTRLPKLKLLFKQILSDRNSISQKDTKRHRDMRFKQGISCWK